MNSQQLQTIWLSSNTTLLEGRIARAAKWIGWHRCALHRQRGKPVADHPVSGKEKSALAHELRRSFGAPKIHEFYTGPRESHEVFVRRDK